jgi:hypothetical protein
MVRLSLMSVTLFRNAGAVSCLRAASCSVFSSYCSLILRLVFEIDFIAPTRASKLLTRL